MIEQIVVALNDAYGVGSKTPRGPNLVAMGAGEPFLAFDPLMKALGVMADREGLFIVPNRVTVSTAGAVPKIRELGHGPEPARPASNRRSSTPPSGGRPTEPSPPPAASSPRAARRPRPRSTTPPEARPDP